MTEQERRDAQRAARRYGAAGSGSAPLLEAGIGMKGDDGERGTARMRGSGRDHQPGEGGVTFAEHQRASPEPGGVRAAAARVAWHEMTELTLMAVCESVERAVSLPARPGWERKAAAHAELFDLMAAAPQVPSAAAGLLRDLMLRVGPGADGLITNSRRRLIACLRARDFEGAAREMETHLRVLDFMGRLARGPADQPRRERP